MKKIELSNKGYTLVDDDIYQKIKKEKWYLSNTGYPSRDFYSKKKVERFLLHRYILGLKKGDGKFVDHINGDKLDNRRENLRLCTKTQNQQNCKINKRNSTGFKGVTFVGERNKYKAQICAKHIKYFNNPIDAAKAYDIEAKKLFGDFARTNF